MNFKDCEDHNLCRIRERQKAKSRIDFSQQPIVAARLCHYLSTSGISRGLSKDLLCYSRFSMGFSYSFPYSVECTTNFLMVHNYAQWREKSLESNKMKTLEMLKCSSAKRKLGSISPAEMHSVLNPSKKSHFLIPEYFLKAMSAVCLLF